MPDARRHVWVQKLISWLTSLILLSRLPRRTTCCVLCKTTLTVVAVILALTATRDWGSAGRIVVIGVVLELLREGADFLLGRPGARQLGDGIRTGNRSQMRRRLWRGYGFLGASMVIIHGFGILYASRAPLNGQDPAGFVQFIAQHAPDMSSVIKSAPRGSEMLGHDFEVKALVVRSYVAAILLLSTFLATIGVTFFARLPFVESAPVPGTPPAAREAAGIIFYFLLAFLIAAALFMGNLTDAVICTHESTHCHRSAVSLAEYAWGLSMMVPAVVFMVIIAENVCRNRFEEVSETQTAEALQAH